MKASEFNKNFVRDLKLPIAVHTEPYFSHFLELINPYYDSVNKYNTFVQAFEENGKELFFEKNKKLTNGLLDYLKAKPEYLEFNNLDIKQYQKEIKISSKELYHPDNKDKNFISIDLVKANFQSLHFVVPTIFDGFTDYNAFVSNFGFNSYMLISKQIRQIIFGNMNPQRQQKIQYYMMNKIAEELIKYGVSLDSVYSLSSDELVFENKGFTKENIEKALVETGFNVRVELFKLERPFRQPMYVKKLDTGESVFKMVPTSTMAEFVKRYEGRELEDLDFFFFDENKRLSKYVEPFLETK